ncbi:hypothetical protein DRJ17_02520 [Candidatus Woesearchaeota archaeon]|nr:MAG: hypothetical protein DRJ17_02520 [Candidatus Woesearchaeota archaeon]
MSNKCVLCNSEKSILLKTGNKKINNFICKKCGLVYVWPTVNENRIFSYYKNGHYDSSHNVKIRFSKKRLEGIFLGANDKYNYIYKYIKKHIKNKTVLEIGCATGHILNIFKLKGFDVLGVEPSEKLAEFAKINYNVNVVNDMFENVKINKSYDLVLCLHTLEHVINPRRFLLKINKLMSNNSILFIEVPNIYKPQNSLKKFFDCSHFYTYSPKTLWNMLALNKFKIIYLDTKNSQIKAFCIKDKDIKPIIDPNEYKREITFLNRYKKNYIIKGYFISSFFRFLKYKSTILLPISLLKKIKRFKKYKKIKFNIVL